jgi:cytochrome P450
VTARAGGRALPPRFDPGDPAAIENPYPAYAELRRAGPLCRFGPGQWAVTRYRDVAALLRDRRLGSAFPPEFHEFSVGPGPAAEFFQRVMIVRDPPEHTRLRKLMHQAFRGPVVRGLREHILTLVDDMLAPALERGVFDAVDDLAYSLPVTVVCELIGIPAADRDEVRPRVEDLVKGFTTHVSEPDRPAVNEAVLALQNYVGGQLDERRARPRDDLLSAMLAAEDGGETLSAEEIVDNAVFLFFAGFETTRNMIATGCAALLEHPDQLARLRADPSLVPRAVEEFLRYDAPVQGAGRLTLEPIRIGDRTIPKNRVVILLLGSANHDEAQFRAPERLDVGRHPNRHVTFGGGSHHCLGAALARVEGAVVFDRLLARSRTLAPAGEPVRRPLRNFRSHASVPVAVEPA